MERFSVFFRNQLPKARQHCPHLCAEPFVKPMADASAPAAPLMCQKCCQATSMTQSSPTGRNPLLRACNNCQATDRWLNRSVAKPKEGKQESEEDKERRSAAAKVKEDLKKKSPEDRARWYAEQKAQRVQEDQFKKRTFSSAVGSVEDVREKGSLEDDVDRFVPFKAWAAQEMALKLYGTLAEARIAWDKIVKDPTSKVMTKNGETLLYQFGGVELRARSSHSLRAGLRQRMDINNQDDLSEYQEESENRIKRARSRLDIEVAANLENEGPESVVPLLTVSKDLGQLKELEESRDQVLQAQALELMQQKKQEAEKKKAEQAAQTRSLPLEKLAFEAARKKGAQSMNDVALRLTASLKAVEDECHKTLEDEGQDLKDEYDQLVKKTEQALQVLSEGISLQESTWEKEEASMDADELAVARQEMATLLKGFHTKSEDVKAVRGYVQEIRNLHAKTKKAIKEREKAQQKSAASKKLQNSKGSQELDALLEQIVNADLEPCGQVSYSFEAPSVLKRLSPTVFETARAQMVLPGIIKMEYYKVQKTWVQEKMKACHSTSCTAMVSKKQVEKKLSTLLLKTWGECYGSIKEQSALAGMPAEMKDYFAVQFGQMDAKSSSIVPRTELNLPTLVLVLEGTLTLGGFPTKTLQAANVTEETKKLEGLKLKDVKSNIQKQGWVMKLGPGGSCLLPPDTVCMEIAGNEDVHTLRHVIGQEAFMPAIKEYLQKLARAAALEQGHRLLHMLEYLCNLAPEA